MNNILIIASAFAPYHGSELGVGFNFILKLSKKYKIYLITQDYWFPYIKKYIDENPNQLNNVEICYESIYPFSKIGPNKYQPFNHYYWIFRVILRMRKMDLDHYDLVHYLNLSTVYLFPFLAFIVKKRFLWGPVGIGSELNLNIFKYTTFSFQFLNIIRTLFINILKFIYYLFFSVRLLKIDYILCRTKDNFNFFSYFKNKSLLPETGFDSEIGEDDKEIVYDNINIVIIGNLIVRKNLFFSLLVFKALLKDYPNALLTIYGDGPLREKITEFILENKMNFNIEIKGLVERSKLLNELKNYNLCLHMGLREGLSWSIMESLSKGVPVCCYDIGANGLLINNKNGILINSKINDPKRVRKEILKFVQNKHKKSDVIKSLKEHTWDRRINHLEKVYDYIIKKYQKS